MMASIRGCRLKERYGEFRPSVPVRLEGKEGTWLMRVIDRLVRKQLFRQMGSSEVLEQYKGCRNTLATEVRWVKRDHEINKLKS